MVIAACPVRRSGIYLIDLYQRYVSPHKGFSCAYRVLHRRRSCSEYIKRALARYGPVAAVALAKRRFAACRLAAERIHAPAEDRDRERRRPDGGYCPLDCSADVCTLGLDACGTAACDAAACSW
jgi:putative component of membrane protein insertase Oxa1/YidC/SpoIIIJ protein YidD